MPFPDNTPTPDDLPGIAPQQIADLPVELLAILQSEVDARLKRDKSAKARLDAALTLRYATRAIEERQARSKDTGTVRFDDGDFTIVADLPKPSREDTIGAAIRLCRRARKDLLRESLQNLTSGPLAFA